MQDIKAEKPSAPNLAGFASRPWIAGLLDPKKINGPSISASRSFAAARWRAL